MLPTRNDIFFTTSDTWRTFVEHEAQKRGLLFIDVVPYFRELETSIAEQLFIPVNTLPDPTSGKHYSAKGNAFISTIVYEAIAQLQN